MNRYRFQTHPTAPFYYAPRPPLAGDALREGLITAIADVTVRDIIAYADGSHDLELQLQRRSHQEALTEIGNALASWGLDVSQALVTEVATQALAGALLGGTGGGVAGATTEDPAAMFFLGALGLIVGAAVGHTREVITAQFNAYRAYPVGTWTFQRLDQVPAPQAAW